jgi:starvation-inducible DNA-binding protein
MSTTETTTRTPVRSMSPTLPSGLQALLVDLTELATQGKQLHWNIVGSNFRDLHQQLDEVVDDARGFADVIAERMRALDAVPDARTTTVAATTALNPVPTGEVMAEDAVRHAVGALRQVVGTARHIHDDIDAEDPSTADLLHGIVVQLEQQAWTLKAELR